MSFVGAPNAKPVLAVLEPAGERWWLSLLDEFLKGVVQSQQAFTDTKPAFPPLAGDAARQMVSASKEFRTHAIALWKTEFEQLVEPVRKRGKKGKLGSKNRLQALADKISGLALVDEQELERSIMVSVVAKHLEERCAREMAELDLRIEHLMCHRVGRAQNPFGPRLLGELFSKALVLAGVEGGHCATVLQFGLFFLDRDYPEFLGKVNGFLKERGVLPEIDADEADLYVRESQEEEAALEKRNQLIHAIAGKTDESERVSDAALYDGLSKLVKGAMQDAQLAEAVVQTSASLPALSDAELVSYLNSIDIPPLRETDSGYLEAPPENVTVIDHLKQVAEKTGKTIDEKSASAVTVVSLLFDQLKQNQNLSGPILHLIDHLRVPFLKSAVLDASFFSDANNPAQDLLNLLAKAAVTWSPSTGRRRDSLYNKVAAIVQRLNDEFEDDYSIFDECISDFELFLHAEKRRARLIEERLITAEKARARTEKARDMAISHIGRRFSSVDGLPTDFNQFLSETWQNVLFFIYNKTETTDCPEWRQALALEEQMLSIFNRAEGASEDEVGQSLRQQLETVGLSNFQITAQLDELLPQLHREGEILRRRRAVEAITDAVVEPAPKERDPDVAVSPETAASEAKLTEAIAEDYVAHAPEVSDDIRSQVQRLAMGDWLTMRINGEGTKVRVAAYIKHSDTFVLVFRSGAKAGQFTRSEMERLIGRNEISVLESTMLFERTLESVIARLRSN